ncbi:MAG: adenylosuccinate synthase [Bacteroidota bacterium]
MSKVDVILGLQWGDEGKGKIVDYLAPHYDIVARFQGGPNAGHTLEFDGKKHVLHQIPSGIFHPGVLNVIGNGVVIDPIIFRNELKKLSPFEIDISNALIISNKAQLILPTHKLLDQALEKNKGDGKIGSTLKGIGPTYQDKIGRNGLRVGDILEGNFERRYNSLKAQHVEMLNRLDFEYDLSLQEGEFFDSVQELREMQILSTEYFLDESLMSGKKVLAEGAQGTLLDIDFGSYPFVTSSNTTTAGACTGLGIAPSKIDQVFGVFKAYCTRVGSGPFPTELNDAAGENLRRLGNEFGATTGRPRRCGWLDLPALKYSCILNGVSKLFMMKADVLSELDELYICDRYIVDGQEIHEIPYSTEDTINPGLTKAQSWTVDQISQFSNLPAALTSFISTIEKYTCADIALVSLGPDRKETVAKEGSIFLY